MDTKVVLRLLASPKQIRKFFVVLFLSIPGLCIGCVRLAHCLCWWVRWGTLNNAGTMWGQAH